MKDEASKHVAFAYHGLVASVQASEVRDADEAREADRRWAVAQQRANGTRSLSEILVGFQVDAVETEPTEPVLEETPDAEAAGSFPPPIITTS